LLNKGFYHCLLYRAPWIHDIVVDIESRIKNLSEDNRQFVRLACHHQTEKKISKLTHSQPLKSTGGHMTQKLKKKNCSYLKSDKGNTTVVMDGDDCYKRTESKIVNGPRVEILKNPLNKVVGDTKTTISNCKKYHQQ
jgi:hypothetical protein